MVTPDPGSCLPACLSPFIRSVRPQVISLLLGLLTLCLANIGQAEGGDAIFRDTPIEERIVEIFPAATRLGEKLEQPPAWPVYQLNELLGYAFESNDLVDLPGFSGDRVNMLIGINTEGVVEGTQIVHHHEPIFLHGLGPEPLLEFVDQYPGRKVTDRIIVGGKKNQQAVDGTAYFDGVTKATVSVIVINDTILSSSLQVARAMLDGFAKAPPAIAKEDVYEPLTWTQLLANGYLKRWQIDNDALEQELGQSLELYSVDLNANYEIEDGLEIYYAYLNSPIIGRNILGDDEFQRLKDKLKPDQHAVAVFSRGVLSYLEDEFRQGTVPNRVSITQQGLPMPMRDLNFYSYSDRFLPDAFSDVENFNVFVVNSQTGLDPSAEMNLTLNFALPRNHLIVDNATLSDTYQLPKDLFKAAPQPTNPIGSDKPLWQRIWENRALDIGVLLLGLTVLTASFIYQEKLTQYPKAFSWFRWGYLTFTVFFVGFYTQGQLSVVNIYTLLLEIYNGFSLDVFLLDPIIFILWVYTAISLIIWGRGLFCGWLCPFGVLQEAVAWVGEKLKIRQWKIPNIWHRRLLLLKYVILVVLVGTSFYSLRLAEQMAEVEPFKTAITLVFVRYWPFVLYAVALLGLGLFVHKFYCRYLCPLGAGLAVVGRLHIFEWLTRRKECGSPCQLCHKRCGINAIKTDGKIDYDECIQCLECVVILRDDNQCAPAKVAKKKEQRIAAVEIHQPA